MTEAMTQEVAASLEPLFKEARATGKWFHCRYQDLWFSPDELAQEQASGRFRWGAVNWTLRHPSEMLEQAAARLSAAKNEYCRLEKRVNHASTVRSSE